MTHILAITDVYFQPSLANIYISNIVIYKRKQWKTSLKEKRIEEKKLCAWTKAAVLDTFGMLRMLGRMSSMFKLMGCEQWPLQTPAACMTTDSFGKLDYVGLIVDPDPFFLTNNMLVCSIKGNMYYDDGSFWLGWALILLTQRTWPNRPLCFYLFRNMALIKHSSAPTRHSLPCRKLTNVKATC